MVAVYGVASLFGFLRISEILPMCRERPSRAGCWSSFPASTNRTTTGCSTHATAGITTPSRSLPAKGRSADEEPEVYDEDPRTNTLLNQGVAKVNSPEADPESKARWLETLRYELTNFVCDGQYAEGLVRILSTYLAHLDKSEQPGVWVSGFFGSGKSHLVKMLQHLWIDFAVSRRCQGPRPCQAAHRTSKTCSRNSPPMPSGTVGFMPPPGRWVPGPGTAFAWKCSSIIFRSVGLPERLRPCHAS